MPSWCWWDGAKTHLPIPNSEPWSPWKACGRPRAAAGVPNKKTANGLKTEAFQRKVMGPAPSHSRSLSLLPLQE